MTTWHGMSAADRFEKYVIPEPMSGCFLWIGSVDGGGYGTFWDGRGRAKAHRYAWGQKHGPIPEGMHVCHKCDNPPCVNPLHLFLGTAKDNARDKIRKGREKGGGATNRAKTHCINGHEFTPENTMTVQGFRRCRACHLVYTKRCEERNPEYYRAKSRAYYYAHREKMLAAANAWYATHRKRA